MPRTSSNVTFEEVFRAAIAPVLARASAAIAEAVAEMAEERVKREIAAHVNKGAGRGRRRSTARPRRNVDMTVWAADRRARRVPNFVIEATGLDTKKKIVARFGEGATFHRGKPLPPVKAESADAAAAKDATAARVVKAKPPRIRKAAAA